MDREQQVLGACLIDENSLEVALEILKPNDFQEETHQELFRDIQRVVKDGVVDIVTVSNVSEISSDYIASLPEGVMSLKNIKQHCNLIREEARKIKILDEMLNVRYDAKELSLKSLLEYIDKRILPLTDLEFRQLDDIQSQTLETIQDIEDIAHNKKSYIKTGFKYVDKKILGFEESEVYILAGRPASGKTALALNMINNIKDRKIMFFSLEMGSKQVIKRLLASKGLIEMNKIRRGDLSDDEWSKIMHTSDYITKKDLTIMDKSFELQQIISQVKQHKPDIVFVDYLQLINGGNHQSKNIEITHISRKFKELAMALNIPIVLISQLSRACEQRTDKRPLMSDLRDSGSIEQDASVIMMLYRDAYYDNDSEYIEYDNKGEYVSDIAEVNIVKQRNGETGRVKLRWIPKWTRFVDYEEEE